MKKILNDILIDIEGEPVCTALCILENDCLWLVYSRSKDIRLLDCINTTGSDISQYIPLELLGGR